MVLLVKENRSQKLFFTVLDYTAWQDTRHFTLFRITENWNRDKFIGIRQYQPKKLFFMIKYIMLYAQVTLRLLLSWLNLKLGHKEKSCIANFIAKSIHSEEFTGSLVFTLGIVSILLLNLQKIDFCVVWCYTVLYGTGFMVWCSYNCQTFSNVIIICCCCWNRSTFPHMISISVDHYHHRHHFHGMCTFQQKKKSEEFVHV